MRSGANSVQHLLTPVALGVLKYAVTEARRRGHPQVQPLHVVSMLLTHAGSRLRQACMLSQPQNSQSAECRALEVCFNVALDHLPQSAIAANSQPILSNALMAALKRAHAHQRRGCPEHQQSPLLAVKVEIDQLIISILDDPSVSRVMKEAGFSSTNVKFNLEDGPGTTTAGNVGGKGLVGHVSNSVGQALSSHEQTAKHEIDLPSQAAGPLYDTSCVTQEENETKASVKFAPVPANQANSMESWQQSDSVIESHERRELSRRAPSRSNSVVGSGVGLSSRDEDVLNILNTFLRPRIRNVILVGDITAANAVNSDLALRIKNGNVPAHLQGLQILDPLLSSSSFGNCSSLEMEQKLAELSKIVGECMPVGAILHIGDLQWLAEPMQLKKGPSNFCPAQRTASELRQLLIRHASSRLWFVGVATPQTFSRLQVLYPSLVTDWGLQPLPLSTAPQPDFLTRFTSCNPAVHALPSVHSTPSTRVESSRVTAIQDSRPANSIGPSDKFQCCVECLAKFEEERRLIHEHESLSLHLSLTGDEASSGIVNGRMGQVSKESVAQQLMQLREKWQKHCKMLHGDPPLSVGAQSRPQLPSPFGRITASSHIDLPKTCGLGVDVSSQWSGQGNRSVTSPAVDQPIRTSPVFTINASRKGAISPLQRRVQVQDAAPPVADKISEVTGGPDAGSPKDGSSVASAPDDHEDPHISTGTSAQNASLASIHTNLALGRVNEASPMAAKLRAPISLALKPSPLHGGGAGVGACPMSVKNNSKPHWLLQSPLQQRRPVTTNPLQTGGLSWQSNASPLVRRQARVSKSPSPPPAPLKEVVDDPTLKGLYKGLMQRVPWQAAAVAGIATTVMKCRSGMGSFRGATAKTDTWLLLLGPDPVAKVAIAKALAEMVFGGERSLLHIGFADGSPARLEADDSGMRYRGRTPLDRLAEAVRLKPSSVILLEDIDKSTSVFKNNIVRAMERGKLADSCMREVSLSNSIIVMTTSAGSLDCEPMERLGALSFSESKLAALRKTDICGRIKNSSSEKFVYKNANNKIGVVDHGEEKQKEFVETTSSPLEVAFWVTKRKPDAFLQGELRSKFDAKRTKSGQGRFLNLDLNLATGESKEGWAGETDDQCVIDFDAEEVKREKVLEQARLMLTDKFCALPDYAVGFDPYNFNGLATEILNTISKSFEDHAPSEIGVEVDLRLLEYLMSCVWNIPDGRQKFNAWVDDVLSKSISRSLVDISTAGGSVVELVAGLSEVKDAFEGVALPHSINFVSTLAV